MVNQTNPNSVRERDANTHSNSRRIHASKNRSHNENMPVDDVIAHLANAHENRRAREVTKWEQIGGVSLWV